MERESTFERNCEEEFGVARRSNCGPRKTRGAPLAAGDPFALPESDPLVAPQGQVTEKLIGKGVDLPFCAFVLVNAVFTYWSTTRPTMSMMYFLVSLDVCVVAGWPKAQHKRHALLRGPLGWWSVCFAIVACVLGLLLGRRNATWFDTYVRWDYLRQHSNVNPKSDPRMFADAGVISFADGVQLDIDASAGYRRWPYIYCAAPVRGANDPDGAIGFWAVGTNCCNSRGGFSCDSALDPKASSGVRAAIASRDLEMYHKAVRMAAAAGGEVAAEEPVLLVWERYPDTAASLAWWWATIAFTVQLVIAVFFCVTSRWLLTRLERSTQ